MAGRYTPRRVGTSSELRYTMSNPDYSSRNKTLRIDPYWLLEADDTYSRERNILAHRGSHDSLPSDEVYTDKLNKILSAAPCIGVPPRPSAVAPGILIGTQANAEDLECLKSSKISHVLNCGALPISLRHARERRYEGTKIVYEELPIDDQEGFPIKDYFSAAHTFIDRARIRNGRVLIHCSGVSRCGAVVLAYLVRSGRKLLESAKDIKRERRCVLCNESFMRQCVEYARQMGMLDPDLRGIVAPEYGRKIDNRRIWSAHLPTVL